MKRFLTIMFMFALVVNIQAQPEVKNFVKNVQQVDSLVKEYEEPIKDFYAYTSTNISEFTKSVNNKYFADNSMDEMAETESEKDLVVVASESKENADNIFKRAQRTVSNADNFWNAVESIGIWLKETAENIYNVYRLQYMLVGLTALFKFLFFLSILIGSILGVRRLYLNSIDNEDYWKGDKGLVKFSLGAVFFLLSIVSIQFMNFTETFPLFNPDYYIIQDLLSAWK